MELVYKAKDPPEIHVKFGQRRRTKLPFCESIAVTAGCLSFSISHVTMSAPLPSMTVDEKEALMAPTPYQQGFLSSKITQLQRATRGYLWLVVACFVLLIAGGILLFPQKTWNRLMLQMFGCVRFKVNGHTFNMCQEHPEPQPNPIF